MFAPPRNSLDLGRIDGDPDQPDFLRDFLDTDILSGKDLAYDLPGVRTIIRMMITMNETSIPYRELHPTGPIPSKGL
jgi:hypothetical protein